MASIELNLNPPMTIDDTYKKNDRLNKKFTIDDIADFETKNDFLEFVFGSSVNLLNSSMTFREKMKHILESNYLHISVVALVVLDTLCIIVDLLIAELKHENKHLEKVEEAFKYIGVAILSLFMVLQMKF